jgi:hypothetical protein
MILQTDPMLHFNIRHYGCYYMCILFMVNKYTGRGFDRGDINDLYQTIRQTEWMEHAYPECYIDDPPKIFTHLGLPMQGVEKKDNMYICKRGQIEILRYQRTYASAKTGEIVTYGHFVCGNGRGVVTYDPAGMSNAVMFGTLESKRIFTRTQ